jgi:WD40 repeat protein
VNVDEDGSLVHWDLLSGRLNYKTPRAHSKAGSSICFHPSSEMFLSSSYDGTVKLWDNKKKS